MNETYVHMVREGLRVVFTMKPLIAVGGTASKYLWKYQSALIPHNESSFLLLEYCTAMKPLACALEVLQNEKKTVILVSSFAYYFSVQQTA